MDAETTRGMVERHYGVPAAPDVQVPVVYLGRHARASLGALYSKLGFTHGVEVGVWDGEGADILFQTVSGLELIGVDAWERFGVTSGHVMPSAFRKARQEAEARLSGRRVTLLNMPSREAAGLVANRSVDFVFVDAAHGFDDVVQDLILWAPKVKSAGIVSGHDWETTALGWPAENGVKEAVKAYVGAHNLWPIYLLEGTARDRWKSYFWVQP